MYANYPPKVGIPKYNDFRKNEHVPFSFHSVYNYVILDSPRSYFKTLRKTIMKQAI